MGGAAYASLLGYLFALIGAFWVVAQEFELGRLSKWTKRGYFNQTSQILGSVYQSQSRTWSDLRRFCAA